MAKVRDSRRNVDASNLSTGTLNDARLTTNVTLKGNTFNGASELIETTVGGLYPALDGSLITNIGSAISTQEEAITAPLTINTSTPSHRFIDGGTSDRDVTVDLPTDSQVLIANVGTTNFLTLIDGVTPTLSLGPGQFTLAIKTATQLYFF